MHQYQNGLYILAALIIAVCVYWGTKNEIDPAWTAIEQQIGEPFFILGEAEDSLVHLFDEIHETEQSQEAILQRIYTPFVPILGYDEFANIVRTVAKDQRVVLSGVNGAGASTLANRVSRFVATDSSNILRVVGVPKFDMHLHYKYIGQEVDGRFERGALFDFFEECYDRPQENFVFILDDVEKIEPETFFGSEFWYKLYEPRQRVMLGGKPIKIPPNLHMIFTVHTKPSAQAVITDLHYQRMGRKIKVQPNTNTLLMYLQEHMRSKSENITENPDILPFVYAFQRANQIITEQYNSNYTMGQWSPIRKMYNRSDYEKMIEHLMFHVNSFNPRVEMRRSDFYDLDYTIKNEGRLRGTNFFSRQFQVLEEKGFLTEFLVGLSFIIASAVFSYFFFRRREKIILAQIARVEQLYQQFNLQKADYDVISDKIEEVKKEVDRMALDKKINYEEATFFYQYFHDKTNRIESAREAYLHFRDLVEVSLQDGELSHNEYERLHYFLDRIKSRIGTKEYNYFKEEIERIYKEVGVRS